MTTSQLQLSVFASKGLTVVEAVEPKAKPKSIKTWQVRCQVCDWKGLWQACPKDEFQHLLCPRCNHHHLKGRDETEQYQNDSSKTIHKLRRKWQGRDEGFTEAKRTMRKALEAKQ